MKNKLKAGAKCPTCKKGKLRADSLPHWDEHYRDRGDAAATQHYHRLGVDTVRGGREALSCPACHAVYPALVGKGTANA